MMLAPKSQLTTRHLPRYKSQCLRVSHLQTLHFSTSRPRSNYDSTIHNLKIGSQTRVIFQGFTGKQATANAQESIKWGTKIVGGVKPGGSGEHLGLPVLPSVRKAVDELQPHATGIYVAAHQAAAAIEEAIEAEVPLIVAVAEHIPLHDMMRIHSMLQSQSKSRLVGANTPGIISAIGKCRIGFQPLPTFSPGHIGIIAKSGTLSYETVGSLTRAGLGQSLCIGMGGDVIAGTNHVDALKVFETDEDTEAVILVGELGGTSEEEAADWIRDYRKRTKNPKPIAAVIGGFQAPPGRVMGHAGAWTGIGEGTAESKSKALADAGVTIVDHPAKLGGVMKEILQQSGRSVKKIEQSAAQAQQRRGYHTAPSRSVLHTRTLIPFQQKRCLHLPASHTASVLQQYNINVASSPSQTHDSNHFLGITVARSARSPCIIASPTTLQLSHRARQFPFDYRTGPSPSVVNAAISWLQLDAAPPRANAQTVQLIHNLWRLYTEKEAITTTLSVSIPPDADHLHIHDPYLFFDDAAFKSNKRQADLHALRDMSSVSVTEQEAEKAGIVYIPLEAPTFSSTTTTTTTTAPSSSQKATQIPQLRDPGAASSSSEPRNLVGTLVNGAGLAMNTNDVLALRLGGPPTSTAAANFLDTGGKATSETIKTSFRLLLADPRVSVVFVNIFGGLTLCDMIADGILLAFRDVGVDKPVVVRLRGTNEQQGQEMLTKADLPISAFDDFEEAVREVGRLANAGRGKGE